MEYDKEFEEMLKTVIGVCTANEKQMVYLGWTEARKDHYRIGEEVESLDGTQRAKICAVVDFIRLNDLVADNVRRIPAKSRVDEIAEEAVDKYKRGAVNAGDLKDIIKSSILQARKEWEAER